MTTTHAFQKNQQQLHFSSSLFQSQIEKYALDALDQFKEITRKYALFHICFFVLALKKR